MSATLSHASSESTTITLTAVSGAYTVGSDKTISIAAGNTSNSSDTATINSVDNTRERGEPQCDGDGDGTEQPRHRCGDRCVSDAGRR